jgi:multidrug efflux pump subunit AcrA (membrane-fusion protein)
MSKSRTEPLDGVYTAAREHLPPLEFALRAPTASSRAFLYALSALIVVALVLSLVLKVPVNLRFQGALRLESPPTRLDSSQEKRIRRVLVREGEHVAQGEILLEVGGVLPEEEERALVQFDSELRILLASERQKACMSTCLESLRRLGREGVPALRAARPRELVASVKGALDEFLAARTERGGVDVQMQELARKREGIVAKERVLERSSRGVDLRFERARLRADLSSVDVEIRNLSSRSDANLGRMFARLDDEGRELSRYVQGVVDERFIRSPLDGHVVKVHVGGVDEVVPAGTALLDIAPKDAVVMAELQVPTRDVASLEEGHELHLALDAFPVHRFGLMRASVESIPRVAETGTNGQLGATPYFKVVARPESQSFTENGRTMPFRGGMTLQATYEVRRERPLVLLFELLSGTAGP